MDTLRLRDGYLKRLRKWRNRPDPDLTLGFIKKQFEREIRRPYLQLNSIAQLWQSLLPPSLVAHTRLESMHRGVLSVSVDSSAHLYELDRLLRSGLERQLVINHKGPAFRRVQLRVAAGRSSSP